MYKKFIFAVVFILFPVIAHGQGVSLQAAKTTYAVGDSFLVSVVLNTAGNNVNTVSGRISIPDAFAVTSVRSGGSIISLWVTQPEVNPQGDIVFAGGTPGGYNGSSGPIISFILQAKQEGTATLRSGDIKLLLNDGQGTELNPVTAGSLTIQIQKAAPRQTPTQPTTSEPNIVEVVPVDNVPPEEFMPLVSQHPSVANNQFFVSFSTVDKDSGIARYEVREGWWPDWYVSRGPYVLKHQWLPYKVYVRAYDQAGNYTEGYAIKPPHTFIIILAILLLMVLSSIVTYLFTRNRKRRARA